MPAFRHVYLRAAELETLSKEQFKHRARREEMHPALRSVLDPSVNNSEGTAFESVLKNELDRLVTFLESTAEELWLRLGCTLETLDSCLLALKSPKKRTTVREDGLEELECECGEMCERLMALDEFARQNILAAAFVAQQHDAQWQDKKNKKLQSVQQINPVYIKAVEQRVIEEGARDPLLLGLSQAYSKIRKLRNRVLGDETEWQPPDTFTRNTTKYWIHPADVLKVKCRVMKHLPILLYGKRPNEGSVASKLMPLKQQTQREHALISSVYFDTDKLDTYHERLIREHGASLIRIRWFV